MLSFPMDFAFNPVMDTVSRQEDSATGVHNISGPVKMATGRAQATLCRAAGYSSLDGATLDECYCVGFTPDAMGLQACPTGSEKQNPVTPLYVLGGVRTRRSGGDVPGVLHGL